MFFSLISKTRNRGFDTNIDDSKRFADSLDVAVMQRDPFYRKNGIIMVLPRLFTLILRHQLEDMLMF